jgi:zinc protease
MKRILFALLLTLPVLAQQVTPPPPAAPRDLKLPQPVEKTLDNGLRVIVVPKHDIPLVAARLLVKTGGAADPKGKAGVAELTSSVLTKGTKTKTAEQISRGVEALGATLAASAQWDSSTVDLSVMSSNLTQAMAYVGDVARNATFADAEVERERGQTIDALQVDLREPRVLASAATARLVFGEAPYGNTLTGTPATVAKIKRDDLLQFHRRYYVPQNAVLVLAGDIEGDAAFKLAQTVFGSWARGTAETVPPPKAAAAAAPRVVVIDMPDAGQSTVTVSRRGIRRADPGYMQALVANSVLGGGYSSRLNQEIRIKRGLSYGAGSSFDPRLDIGPFTASTNTKHESAAEVAQILAGEVGKLSEVDVPDTELTPRKAALIGEFAQSLETTSGLVNELSSLALYGLPLRDINQYISGVQSVTPEQVRKFASTNLGRDTNVVIVGDASKFLEPLRKQFGEVEVIKVEELDLASPTLRVRKAKG